MHQSSKEELEPNARRGAFRPRTAQGRPPHFHIVSWRQQHLRRLDPAGAVVKEIATYRQWRIIVTRSGILIDERGIRDVQLAEANVLTLDALPASWNGYDMIVSAAMLEYVPRESLPVALSGLRAKFDLAKGNWRAGRRCAAPPPVNHSPLFAPAVFAIA